MAAPVTQINFTGDDAIRCHATFLATVQVVDSGSGDAVPLTDFDEVSAVFRTTAGASSAVFTVPYKSSDSFPENGCWWVDKTLGKFEICISSILSATAQTDGSDATVSGTWDALVYTTATGAPNSYQLTVAEGSFQTKLAVTRVTP